MEFTVFTAAPGVLGFGFVTKTVLVVHQVPVAEQCLQGIKAFSLFPALTHQQVWLRVGKTLGGNTVGTNDLHWPKEYSIPYNVMLTQLNHQQ